MDGYRFDTLIRLLAIRRSRRGTAVIVAGAFLPAMRRSAAACDPDCAGRACGGDGCGGSCGECPTGSTCIDDLGICAVAPPDCQTVGETCGSDQVCCDLLVCDAGICTLPECVETGQPCGPGRNCCEGSECLGGFCADIAPSCAPTGKSCRSVECCEREDVCVVGQGGAYTCVTAGPVTPPCAHAGQRPERIGVGCCRRLALQEGRCVVNRWDRCDRRRNRRAPCARGSRCRGGRHAVNGRPVCVPA
jgi:hypothetical protein